MNTILKPIRTEYQDGKIIISNVRSKVDNSTVSYTVVSKWWDGSDMDDSKVDQFGIYSKFKETGEYVKQNLPSWGEVMLEVDTVQDLRNITDYNLLLLKLKYYKGVRLNGYYTKGDTPASVDYYLYTGSDVEDGGSVFEVGGIKLKHEFGGDVNIKYFGAFPTWQYPDLECSTQVQKCFDYTQKTIITRVRNVYAPFGVYRLNKGINISANGWSGKFFGDGVKTNYSTRFLAIGEEENSIYSLFYVKGVLGSDGKVKDRFGVDFSSYAMFGIYNVAFDGGRLESSTGSVQYASKSVARYGLDVSFCYSIIVKNNMFLNCQVGCSIAKWDVVFSNNFLKFNRTGLEVCVENNNNKFGTEPLVLAGNGILIQSNNFYTNRNCIIALTLVYDVWIKNNILDRSSASGIIVRNPTFLNFSDNYCEGLSFDQEADIIEYYNLDNNLVSENVIAQSVVFKRSDMQNVGDRVVWENNQYANTNYVASSPFIALNGIDSIKIDGTTFRGYVNGGVYLFGNGARINRFSNKVNDSSIRIDSMPNNSPIIKFSSPVLNNLKGIEIVETNKRDTLYGVGKIPVIFNNYSAMIPSTQGQSSEGGYYESVNYVHNESNQPNTTIDLKGNSVLYFNMNLTFPDFVPLEITGVNIRIVNTDTGDVIVNNSLGRYNSTSKKIEVYDTAVYVGHVDSVTIHISLGANARVIVSDFCISSSRELLDYKIRLPKQASKDSTGLVKQSANVTNVSTTPPTQLGTQTVTTIEQAQTAINNLVTMVNALQTNEVELKAKLNSKLDADRASGQQSTT